MDTSLEIKIPTLPFITTAELTKHVETVINTAKKSLISSDKKFYQNSVDPFSALFDALWQDIPISEWVKQEKSRQNQKTLQNALGDFHQNVLGSVTGWDNLGKGKVFDVKNDKKKIIAEVKNKHNTTKGNHKVAIYDDLEQQLNNNYPGYTAYYVEVIPKNKKVYDKPFIPPDNRTHSRRATNDSIRVIDGKSFYALATGDKDALEKIYSVLPFIIAKVLGKSPSKLTMDSSFKALFDTVY
jgi:hypothetical protein